MTKGAVHPNGTNFRRVARLDVVARVRRLCESKLLAERPKWLEWCERVPPLENHNLKLQARTVRNPYPQMVQHVLKKYPELRFQDCYVDGNDWSVGNDAYRDDHPAMQFVARQLDFMRTDGMPKWKAFEETEKLFRERRQHLEREQKVMMAMALDSGVTPMFTTGTAYLQAERAKAEAAHLNIIRRRLRGLKHEKLEKIEAMKAEEKEEEEEDSMVKETLKTRSMLERKKLREADELRQTLCGSKAQEDDTAEAVAEEQEKKEEEMKAQQEAMRAATPPDEEEVQDSQQQKQPLYQDKATEKLMGGARIPSETLPSPAPSFTAGKADEDLVAVQKPRESKAKAVGDMLKADSGGVAGEDMSEDDFDLSGAARRRAAAARRGFGSEGKKGRQGAGRKSSGEDDFEE